MKKTRIKYKSPGVYPKETHISYRPGTNNQSQAWFAPAGLKTTYRVAPGVYVDRYETSIWDDCVGIWEVPEKSKDLLEDIYEKTLRELTTQIDKEIMEKLMKVRNK